MQVAVRPDESEEAPILAAQPSGRSPGLPRGSVKPLLTRSTERGIWLAAVAVAAVVAAVSVQQREPRVVVRQQLAIREGESLAGGLELSTLNAAWVFGQTGADYVPTASGHSCPEVNNANACSSLCSAATSPACAGYFFIADTCTSAGIGDTSASCTAAGRCCLQDTPP